MIGLDDVDLCVYGLQGLPWYVHEKKAGLLYFGQLVSFTALVEVEAYSCSRAISFIDGVC